MSLSQCINKIQKKCELIYIKPENIMNVVNDTAVTLTDETAFINIVIDNKFLTHSQINSPSDKFPLWVNNTHKIYIASHNEKQQFKDDQQEYAIVNHTIGAQICIGHRYMRILNPLVVIIQFLKNKTLDLNWDEKMMLISQFARIVLQLSPK